MKTFCAAILLLGAISCNSTFAGSKFYGTVDEFLESIPNLNSSESLVAEGDLNSDNLKDFAVAVKIKPTEFERHNQLHILVQEKTGKFSLAASSKKSPVAGMGCCWVENIEIKRGSVFLQNNAKMACEMEAATHQFKYYKTTWRLIGLKIFNYSHCKDPQISEIRDFNLLTGKMIKSTQLDDRPKKYEHMEFTPNKSLLKDFDFYNGFGAPET